MALPTLPEVELEVVEDCSPKHEGFLNLQRLDLAVVARGRRSVTFRYDIVTRRAIDAAVMLAHFNGTRGRCVFLRSAIRPPVGLRTLEPVNSAVLWELPAGLIEPGEAPNAAAARELAEELGFAVAPEAMLPLGSWTYPAPGFVAEMHWFFHTEVDPKMRKEPGGDGSPLEEGAAIISVSLREALAACADGTIRDAKTELALRRLQDLFP